MRNAPALDAAVEAAWRLGGLAAVHAMLAGDAGSCEQCTVRCPVCAGAPAESFFADSNAPANSIRVVDLSRWECIACGGLGSLTGYFAFA